ncbi:uncharacterized protein LOC103517397 [Diaphorina citri]|uniref:Uncharacterized protein LOC103517397 n=1 Tax=Diaphorina citri TaxID=121845 RepID=A0A3Q0JA31_DIACI|nr:uncharacterized protein LOC103517397 [Diaphorina citri]
MLDGCYLLEVCDYDKGSTGTAWKLSSQFAKDVDVYSSDIHYIESSPSHKVKAWLEKHLNGEKSIASPEINELKIEDFNSEEMPEDERDTVMSSKIEEAPEGDKENMDLLNTVQTQGTLEPVEKQLVIEDFNTEKVQDRNTQKIVEDVNIEKYKNGTPLKVVEKINTKTTEHVRTQRMIEETNTEKFTNTQKMIEEINTEKCEDLMCSQDEQSFQIECPGSPDAAGDNGETVRAAQILMSFNNWTLPSRDHDITVVPEKTIKFKPGSLGARLRLELNKQKSATEIWKYEVTKATESQDQETLAQLFRGQLDLTIVNFWSECSNVVVKAVKTQPSPGSTDTDNTVLLLLHASNFPARFKTQRVQSLTIIQL